MIQNPIVLPFHLRPYSLQVAAKQKGGAQQIKFVNPNTDNFERNIRHAASLPIGCARKGVHEGARAVIVGSGPTLQDPAVLARIRERVEEGALVYACKAAIKYLWDRGIRTDYGVSMDPGAHIASPKKIFKAPDTTHILASSSDPEVFRYLMEDNEWGPASKVLIFHSACGFRRDVPSSEWTELPPEQQELYTKASIVDKEGEPLLNDDGEEKHCYIMTELTLYEKLFEEGHCVGGGFNVVNRALHLAEFMGCTRFTLAGTDCGWRPDEDMYVDGPAHRPGVDMNDDGKIELTEAEQAERAELLAKGSELPDGEESRRLKELNARVWWTRPDMLASGVALARLAQEKSEDVELLGDTLPYRLLGKDDAFLDRCASFDKG